MDNSNDTPATPSNLHFVECFTGQKWVPLECLPLDEAERHAAFMRLGAVKPDDVRLVPLDKVMEDARKAKEAKDEKST